MSNVKTNSTSFTASTENDKKAVGPSVTVKTETAGKIGLIGAISIIIGAIIGVGIFLKNNGVFGNNNGNPWAVLLSWGLVFLIAFATAFSYGEITRVKTKTANAGLAGWSERYVGYNFGRFLKIIYPFFYYAVYVTVMSIFFAEAIYCINPSFVGDNPMPVITGQSFWGLLGVGFAFALFLILINWISDTFVSKALGVISLVKFIPILMVIIFGIWGGVKTGGGLFNPSNFGPGQRYPEYSGQFDITGVFMSLPAIMFAFDSFLIVGNVSGSVKNPTKNIPLSVILSMAISGTLYILVTVSQLVCGCSNPYVLFALIFQDNETLKITFIIIISILMCVALLGVVTALCTAGIKSTQSAIDEEVIIGSRWLKKVSQNSRSKLTGGCIMSVFVQIFWFALIGIASAVMSTDQIFDGLSNIVVVLMFTVYGFVTLMSVVNRKTHKVPKSEVPYQKGQVPMAIIGAVGCFLVPLYQMVYVFLYQAIVMPKADFSAWGLFWGNETVVSFAIAAIIFWGGVVLFIAMPFINDLFIKATNKNYKQALLWEKVKVKENIEIKK